LYLKYNTKNSYPKLIGTFLWQQFYNIAKRPSKLPNARKIQVAQKTDGPKTLHKKSIFLSEKHADELFEGLWELKTMVAKEGLKAFMLAI